MDKQNYLLFRPFILSGQFNSGVMQFLANWCESEERRFDILMYILNKANDFGFVGDLLNRMVNYLDGKHQVTKLYNSKTGQIINVY